MYSYISYQVLNLLVVKMLSLALVLLVGYVNLLSATMRHVTRPRQCWLRMPVPPGCCRFGLPASCPTD
jgi:hypothetical protein